jgi:hypothetical protein
VLVNCKILKSQAAEKVQYQHVNDSYRAPIKPSLFLTFLVAVEPATKTLIIVTIITVVDIYFSGKSVYVRTKENIIKAGSVIKYDTKMPFINDKSVTRSLKAVFTF